jgi:serine/threonine-protein kinase
MNQGTQSRLTVLLVTDIVGSTDLKSRIGLGTYARLLEQHDSLFKRLIANFASAEILKDTGDGYFTSFPTNSDAVRFALALQQELTRAAWDPQPLKVRVGIHVGEVAQMELEPTGKPKLVGMAADVVTRVAHLAAGSQILLTRFAFNEARQFVSSSDLRWIAHGQYLLRGADEPIDIYEVGVEGIAPLTAPPGNEGARRAVGAGEEDTLGWRPAAGLEVPDRPQWILDHRLGEGGFGEVWLGRHPKLGLRRVFKFCFDAERLRSFKREIALFRLLRETLGDRKDIARLHEVKIDSAPYFLESDYTEGGDIIEWSSSLGGIDKVSLSTRLNIMARAADAVAAAHSVGVLHKDIKPSNILIWLEDGQPRPRLADFGIGVITDRAKLDHHGHPTTSSGYTSMTMTASTQTGTRLYVPPEVLVGKPFTVQGDIYALGVLLYQVVVGDLHRPLAEGWQRDVAEELIRDDIAACVEGDPARRLSSAVELATRLHSLEARRGDLELARERERLSHRRNHLVRFTAGVAAVLVLLLAIAATFALRERSMRQMAEEARNTESKLRQEAEAARAAESRQRAIVRGVNLFLDKTLTSVEPDRALGGRDTTVARAIDAAYDELVAGRASADPADHIEPEVEASILDTLGRSYRALGRLDRAEQLQREAYEMTRKLRGPDDAETYAALGQLGVCLVEAGKYKEAEDAFREAVDGLTRRAGAEDTRALTYCGNLAVMLMRSERLAEAEPIVRKVYEARVRQDGRDDEKTLNVQMMLASIYYQRGEFKTASDLYTQVYESRKRRLGENHPLTLLAGSNAAPSIARAGRPQEAEQLLAKLVEAQRATVGESHPRTLKAMENRAAMLLDLNRADEALVLMRQVIDIRRRSQGNDHPETLFAQRQLAVMLSHAGKIEEATQIFAATLDAQRRVLGDNNLETLRTMNHLAVAYSAQKKYDAAEALHREVVEGTAALLGAAHPTVILYRIDLATTLFRLERVEDAEQQLTSAWNAARAESLSPGTRRSIALRMAKVYESRGDRERATHYRELAAAATQPAAHPATSPSAAAR